MRIRDPIHGTIPVSDEEKAVIDSRVLPAAAPRAAARLRRPGLPRRHAHPARPLAGRHARRLAAVRRGGRALALAASDVRERFCAAVRLAVLCHDLGHMPLSHASERIAPPRVAPAAARLAGRDGRGRAGHARGLHREDAARQLADADHREATSAAWASRPEAAVALITGAKPPEDPGFTHEGRGLDAAAARASSPASSTRTAWTTCCATRSTRACNYGRYDLDWIVQNLNPAVKDGRAYLALSRAAAFAFEDFLLSRYHMFVSVYYHHTSVNFDYMLRRYYEESPGEFEIPSDPEAFLALRRRGALVHAAPLEEPRGPSASPRGRASSCWRSSPSATRATTWTCCAARCAMRRLEHFTVESRDVLSKYVGPTAGGPEPVHPRRLHRPAHRGGALHAALPALQRRGAAVAGLRPAGPGGARRVR